MTKILDVNIVVAAHRGDHAHNAALRPWIDQLISDEVAFSVPGPVVASFVRIVTNHRIWADPSPPEDAFGFMAELRSQLGHVTAEPGAGHLSIFERLCVECDARGDLVPDAYVAALAIEHGATLVSIDRDFARLEGLRWERPE